ncbi:heterokaryon incompatibility [Apiospora kogelbergensis]|uniref:heterokaryon incompatibility n=1 Tax=Apiospora kogelbergensis TaxID=1337665 RepID=UPI00312CE30A
MGTYLCEECKCLEFDDATPGGFHWTSTEGRSFLAFDEDDDARIIPLDYRFEDCLPDLPRLAESARNGCAFCKLLQKSLHSRVAKASDTARVVISMKYIWKLLDVISYRCNHLLYPDRGLVALVVQIDLTQEGSVASQQPWAKVAFDIDSEPGLCQSWLRLETSPRPDVLDAANVAMIQQSFDFQRPSIVQQGKSTDVSLLPARLIDLGTAENASSCRLVLTHAGQNDPSLQQSGYASLSYCWGNANEAACQYKTGKDNLAERLSGFDIMDTTAVVRDAATVCRTIGIRYLWVDAVCIVQDDKDDWERESQKMSFIYQNAAATICPISSDSCLEGFLHRTSHSVQVPFRSKVNEAIQGEFTLRYTNANADFMRIGNPVISTLEAWSRGGVCFNERFYYDQWMTMLEMYSILELSYETDRLPALSGLASYFKKALPRDKYLAGLWERDIHRQLFWNIDGTLRGSLEDLLLTFGQINGNYIAPSWSCIRKDKLVTFNCDKFNMKEYTDYGPEYNYLESWIVPDGLDRTGRLRDASLLICSRFMSILYTSMMDRKNQRWQIRDDRLHYVADCDLDWVEETDGEGNGNDEKGDWRKDVKENEGTKVIGEKKLTLLLLGSCTERDDSNPFDLKERYAWGIVICAAPEIDPAAYVRVGVFYSDPTKDGGLKLFEKCEQGGFMLK